MEIRVLKYFLAVARELSILAAADTLHITQPTLSLRTLLSNDIKKWIGREHNELNIIATYNLLYNAVLMADEGLVYVLSLDKLIRTNDEMNICFIPLKSDIKIPVDIAWKKYQVFSKAAELFLKRLRDKFGDGLY